MATLFPRAARAHLPTPSRVRARPVVGRRQLSERAPYEHRIDHAPRGPAALDRARVARLAIRVGVALAVARLRVGAAAAAHALVAGLDRACLIASRIVEIRLDGCLCASQPTSDLRGRQTSWSRSWMISRSGTSLGWLKNRLSGGTPVSPEILLRGASRRSATRLVAIRRSSGSSDRKNSAVWSRSGWSAHASATALRNSSFAGRSSV